MITSWGVTTLPSMLAAQADPHPAGRRGRGQRHRARPGFPPTSVLVAFSEIGRHRRRPPDFRPGSTRARPAPPEILEGVPKSKTTRVGTETGNVVTSNVAPVSPSGMNTMAAPARRRLLLTRDLHASGRRGTEQRHDPVTVLPATALSGEIVPPQRIGQLPIEFCCQNRP